MVIHPNVIHVCFAMLVFPSLYFSVCDDGKFSSFSPTCHMVMHSHPSVSPTHPIFPFCPPYLLFFVYTFAYSHAFLLSDALHFRFYYLVCLFVGQIFIWAPREPVMKRHRVVVMYRPSLGPSFRNHLPKRSSRPTSLFLFVCLCFCLER